jgi:peptidyl-prolyl cis-trans isomerase-like 4
MISSMILRVLSSILQSGRIGADEEIDDFKGRSAEEVEEIKAEKEAKTQAILLEMVR